MPVRPDEPLAGLPDRSPIPLADSVTAGAAAVSAGRGPGEERGGNGFQRAIWDLQEALLPRRQPAKRKVTAATSRMEMQRRAATALLALIAVGGALVVGVYAVGGRQDTRRDRVAVGRRARVPGREGGARLGLGARASTSSPTTPAARSSCSTPRTPSSTRRRRARTRAARSPRCARRRIEGLDRLYGVVPVASSSLFTFPAEKPPKLEALVRGSDGAPYVLDTANKTVWRIDLKTQKAKAILKNGTKASGAKASAPKLLTTGGPDILILDDKNTLFRWRPSNSTGKGTLVRVKVKDSASWGDDVKDISTFVANFDAAFYKLYVVDPSEQNIMVLSPANDGSGYPQRARSRGCPPSATCRR